jgi:hypothetical protein
MRTGWGSSVHKGRLRRRLGACLIAGGLLFVAFEGVRMISERRFRDAYVESAAAASVDGAVFEFFLGGACILAGIALVVTTER